MKLLKRDEERLFKAIQNKNILKVYSILKNNKKLNLNEKNIYGDYPLLWACFFNSSEIIRLLIDYANKNNIILELNKKNKNEQYPILCACAKDNIRIVKFLIDYANKNHIKLELNEKDKYYGQHPLLCACANNNIAIFHLLIEYANKNSIKLELKDEQYPLLLLLLACYYNNTEMVQLYIDYATENNIKLELNEKNNNQQYPLLHACENDNIEIINLLIDYATENNITLEFDEDKIKNQEILTLLNNHKKEREEINETERKRRENEEREKIEKEKKEKERNEREKIEKEKNEKEKNEKEQYINKLKDLINDCDANYELINDKYCEWKISNWNGLFYNELNYEFFALNYLWQLSIKLETEDNEEYLKVSLNLAENLDKTSFICTNFVISLRNSNDYANFTTEIYNEDLIPKFITNRIIKNNGIGLGIYPEDYSSIIDDNKATIGIYIQFYKEN